MPTIGPMTTPAIHALLFDSGEGVGDGNVFEVDEALLLEATEDDCTEEGVPSHVISMECVCSKHWTHTTSTRDGR
jgi:hypothetical protein